MGAILFKIYILALFILIGISLVSGLFFLAKDESNSKRLVTSLTFRVTLSILLFISLLVGYKFGLVSPHGRGF
ncbi:MAG: twin transmembrane helix small protein [Gammaproteobacteria bacterium]